MNAVAQSAAEAANAVEGIASSAVFVTDPVAPADALVLGGAAGIAGPPLDALVAAVGNPVHPIRRAVDDPEATFDVTPMNPGGPRLRSHLPIRTAGGTTRGVLAVAHDEPLSGDARDRLRAIASEAAAGLA